MIAADDKTVRGSLTAAWDGATPTAAPANTTVDVSMPANGSAGFQLGGTFVGTITFEASLDFTTFVTIPATKLGATPVQATTATTGGIYIVHAPSALVIRARCSAFTSGTIGIVANGSVAEFIPSAAGLAAAGGSTTVVGGKTNNNAAPGADNVGVLPATANAAAPSWTEGNQVLLSSDLTGRLRVLSSGALTNNAAAPAATNQGTLTALANAASPSWSEGNQVLLSSDLAGRLRVLSSGNLTNNNAAPTTTNFGSLAAIANAAVPTWTEGRQVLLSVDLAGQLRTSSVAQVQGVQAAGAVLANNNPIIMGFVGTGTTVVNTTAINSLDSTGPAVSAPGVGIVLKDIVGGNYFAQRGDASGRAIVVGPIASGSAVAGAPVLIGASDGTNAQTLKTAPATNASATNVGVLFTQIGVNTGSSTIAPLASANGLADASSLTPSLVVAPWIFNGTNWDRNRNNVEATLLTSASRTTTQVSAAITTYNAGAITVIIDMTVVGTGSVTVSIDGVEAVSGGLYNLLTGAAVVTNVRNVYVVDPAIPAVANVSAQKRLPRTIKITVTANNANAATYSVSYVLQPC